MPVIKVCPNCSVEFSVKPSKAQRQTFCKKQCVREWERDRILAVQVPPIEFQCQNCGKAFYMKRSNVTAYRVKHSKDPAYCCIACSAVGRRKKTDARWASKCIQCGKPIPLQRRRGGIFYRGRRLCSSECRSIFRRLSYQTKHPNQPATTRVARDGYVRIVIPGKDGKPSRDTLQHRYVMEQHLGRALLKDETVHHLDGNRQHNDISNLELFSSRHGPGQRVADKVAFAIDILRTYPEFALEAGVRLVNFGNGDHAARADRWSRKAEEII